MYRLMSNSRHLALPLDARITAGTPIMASESAILPIEEGECRVG